MSSKINWNRNPEKGWGPWKGIGKLRISDPAKKTDRSPKTRHFTTEEKAELVAELETKKDLIMKTPRTHCKKGHEQISTEAKYRRADGTPRCPECGRQHQREYYLANLEREQARSREYRLAHRDENREYQREYNRKKRAKEIANG
jgi:hypothetical protein